MNIKSLQNLHIKNTKCMSQLTSPHVLELKNNNNSTLPTAIHKHPVTKYDPIW